MKKIFKAILKRFKTLKKQKRVNTPKKVFNSLKSPERSLYAKYKTLYLAGIAEFETMETCSSLHYELNTRIIDALQGDLLVLEAYKLLKLVS